jgi:DUF1009 family protein
MTTRAELPKLGIIAGAGQLPIAIAEASRAMGRPIFVLALQGIASPDDIRAYPHAWVSLGELGRAIKLLKEAGCVEITLAGKVSRPEFTKLKLDARGALALPRVMAAAIKGDDALLRMLLSIFEKEGMRIVGSDEAAQNLLAPVGALGQLEPKDAESTDILLGSQVVQALGRFDIGQAAVVCEGLVLAVEAAEGTDQMLMRVAMLSEALRGTQQNRRGVLVKSAKPNQERRVDLPVIGVRTVELASSAGLSGIAIEAGAALIMDMNGVAEAADRHGLFVCGFEPEDRPGG